MHRYFGLKMLIKTTNALILHQNPSKSTKNIVCLRKNCDKKYIKYALCAACSTRHSKFAINSVYLYRMIVEEFVCKVTLNNCCVQYTSLFIVRVEDSLLSNVVWNETHLHRLIYKPLRLKKSEVHQAIVLSKEVSYQSFKNKPFKQLID